MKSTHLKIKSRILILTLLILTAAMFAGTLTESRSSSPAIGLGPQFNDLITGLAIRSPELGLFPTATPTIVTDRTGYFAGSTVQITGSGYLPGQLVTLQVIHADGMAEAGGGHEAFTVTADEFGGFTATWSLGRDPNGHNYSLLADTVAVAVLYRIASIQTDKYDYEPGENVQLTGEGFDPGETVTLQVVHSNGANGGVGHQPFDVTADQDGRINASWNVNADDSLKSLFRLTANGHSSGLDASSTFMDAEVTIVDDMGADDYPGQKDLNYLTVDHAPLDGDLGIAWGWDDTAWSGNNTGDACALIDTDSDGLANYSLCVTVENTPAVWKSTRLYSCHDTQSDRCDNPTLVSITHGSEATASVTANSDPFGKVGGPYYDASHVTGNTCGEKTGCYTADTVANLTVFMDDVGGAASANLINVCSFPSQEPNSAPSECVITPNNGLLTIKKTTVTPNSDTVTFSFTSTPASQTDQPAASSSYSKAITGAAANVVVAQSVSYAPTTTLDLTETIPSDWNLDSASCYIQTAIPTQTGTSTSTGIDKLEIRSGLETICTFNDSLAQGSLQIVKRVVNDNGGTAGVSAFGLTSTAGTLTFDSGTADGANTLKYTSQKITVDTGTYTLREDDINGYTEGTWSCTGATPSDNTISAGAVTVPAGTDVVCTITNDDVAPQLTLNKHVVNDNGGTANASAWTLTATGSSGGFSGAGSPATGTDAALGPNDVTAGVEYTLSESGGPSGYSSNSVWACTGGGTFTSPNKITLGVGETASCTITNNDDAAQLTVIKHVINDNGGNAGAGDFTMNVTGTNVSSASFPGAESPGTTVTLDAGSYSADESAFTGYTKTIGANCSGTIAVGESKTCTITNDDIAPKLTLTKVVQNNDGGEAGPNDFGISVGGTTVTSGVKNTYQANTPLAINETGHTGYNFVSITGDAKCPSVLGGTITLDEGDDVSCTITNDDIAPKLKLVKTVVNDNGGTLTESDFPRFIDGNAVSWNVSVELMAGAHTASETPHAGYAASSWGGDCAADGTITLAPGDDKTCTITNDDIAPKLKLVKTVTKDNGGTAVPNDWDLVATGDGGFTELNPGSASFHEVKAGINYSLSEENGPSGYQMGGFVCTGFQAAAKLLNAVPTDSVTLNVGDEVTCTVNNDDIAPTLTLVKEVVNDDGGNAVVADFPLFINGSPVTSGASNMLNANTLYTATETNLPGYAASNWTGDCAENGTITLLPGDNKTCTITNNDIAPTLKLVKLVTNNSGGLATADSFTLFAAASGQNDGRNFSNLGGSGVFNTVLANVAYDLSESAVAGYTAGNWMCDNGVTVIGSAITLTEGQTGVTCTITNDDQTAHLKRAKTVTNDNGGSADPTDFTLSASGPTPITGAGGAESDVNAGTYTLSEAGLPGYTAGDWSCPDEAAGTPGTQVILSLGESMTCTINNDDQQAYITVVKVVHNDHGGTALPDNFNLTLDGNAALSGISIPVDPGIHTAAETLLSGYTFDGFSGDCDADGKVTIALGESKTCTLTNSDQQAYITVVKNVIKDNGGTAEPDDFALTLGGNPATSGLAIPVNPGTYAAAETQLPGYEFTGYSGDCNQSGQVTVALGESKTCTLTNNDIQPKLVVTKHVINDNGGQKVAGDFTMSVTGNSPSPASFAGDEGGTNVMINAGSYSVGEMAMTGYTPSLSGDCEGTIAIGEVKSCTVTNDDIGPSLTLVKQVTTDNGGTAQASVWTLTANGPTGFSGVGPTVNNGSSFDAGIYDLSESGGPNGYAASDWVCVGGSQSDSDTISLALGESATCTITNDDIAPKLKLVKAVTNDNGGNADPSDWELVATGNGGFTETDPDGAVASFHEVLAGETYALSEQGGPSGYQMGSFICTGFAAAVNNLGPAAPSNSVVLNPGDQVTCTVNNNDEAPHITLIKNVVNDNGGNASADDFGLSVGGGTVLSGVKNAYSANEALAINEAGLTGYSFVSITGDAKCPSALGGTITLDEGDDITCTITNDDIAPTLTLVKDVVNNSGGTAGPDDFGISVAGSGVTSGATNSYNANTPLAINEAGLAGYLFVNITGDAKCPSTLGGTVTLNEGENVTCRIKNDDQPGTLIVKKVLITPDLTVGPEDFSFSINGQTSVPFEVDGQNNYTVNAGVYDIVEDAETGYVTSYSNCEDVVVPLGGSATCTITNVYQTGFVTSSSLCTFDVDPNRTGDQFRLLFTPDVQSGVGIYKLNASNPGQFYYNVLHYNSTGAPQTITMTIPYPFVTQGATPIHAYSSVTVNQSNGQACLVPGTELFGLQAPILLSDFNPQSFTATETVQVEVPAGFSYINIHLDYGLKKTTGYLKGDSSFCSYYNATNSILIPGCNSYTFSNGGTHVVESVNVFKKNPGTAGQVTLNFEPVEGAEIQLWSTKMIGSAFTDEDGWYQILYKHTGKAQTFTLKYLRSRVLIGTKQIQLKANGFVQVDFP